VGAESDEAAPEHRSGRAVLRAGREGRRAGRSPFVRFVWAPAWPIRVLHFPVRSLAQVRRRTGVVLAESGVSPGGPRARLRERYEAGEMDRIHAELVWDDAAVESGLQGGELVRDERLRDLLAICPDPLDAAAPGPGSVRVEPSPPELERELADVERDALGQLSTLNQRLVIKTRRLEQRVEELQARQRKLRRRNRGLEASADRDRPRAGEAGSGGPWRRLRARASRIASRLR
jgi:hypothetical protein